MDVPAHLKGRDFLRVADWSSDDLAALLDLAAELKRLHAERAQPALLTARTLGMIFDKPSTRTRVSFAAGMAQLGGAAVPLATGELQLGRGETVRDTALVLSRYLDAVVVLQVLSQMLFLFDFHPIQASDESLPTD